MALRSASFSSGAFPSWIGCAPAGARQHFDGNSIAVADLKGPGVVRASTTSSPVERIATRGLCEYLQARRSGLRGKRHFRVAHARLRREQQRARPRFAAARNDVVAGLRRSIERDRSPFAPGVLDHHHGVRAVRHARARHDFDALPGPTTPSKVPPARSSPMHSSRAPGRGRIRGTHGEAVARGAIEGRIIAVGRHMLGQDAAKRLLDFDGFAAQRPLDGPATSTTFCRASV